MLGPLQDCPNLGRIELCHEGYQILDTLAGRLVRQAWGRPQLKVGEVVIGAVAVAVMDRLEGQKLPAQMLLHDVSVFRDPFSINEDDAIAAMDVTGAARLDRANRSVHG